MAEAPRESGSRNESLSENPEKSLVDLVEDIRKATGVEDVTLLDEWEERRHSGELIGEAELEKRIQELEKQIDAVTYGDAIERSMYYAVLEKLRLRLDAKHGRMDPIDQKDIATLRDLGRRIAYAQYEEGAIDEILEAVMDMENYRKVHTLDRPKKEGGVARDMAIETQLKKQLVEIRLLLPKMARVRKLQYYEGRLAEDPKNAGARVKIEKLRSGIPELKKNQSSTDYYGTLDQSLRDLLGRQSVKKKGDIQEATTPAAVRYAREIMEQHFDSILERRENLKGRTGDAAEAEKNALSREHGDMLEDFLRFNQKALARRALVVGLLARQGSVDQPVEDSLETKKAVRDFGLLKNREALGEELDRNTDAVEQYIQYFRKEVLREDKRLDLPGDISIPLDPTLLMEDIMTTHIIPQKLKLVEPIGDFATFWWIPQDKMLGAVGIDSSIRDRRKQQFLQPIFERLGLPENYSELSDAEQKEAMNSPVVQERLKSVKKIIDDFRRNHVQTFENLKNDLNLLRQLTQKMTDRDYEDAGEPVIPEDLTTVEGLRTSEELQGALIFLTNRIETTRVQELGDAQTLFMQAIKKNLDLNIDVADVETQLGTMVWTEWAKSIALLVAEAVGAYQLVRRGVPYAFHKGPAAIRGIGTGVRILGKGVIEGGKGAVNVGVKAAEATAEGVRNLSRSRVINQTKEQLTKMRYLERERAAAKWLQETKMGKNIAKMRMFSGAKFARGAKALEYVGNAALFAEAGYRMYLTHERAEDAKDNPELRAAYEADYAPTALEFGALAAIFALKTSLAKKMPLIGAVIVSTEHKLARTATDQDWTHEVEDWLREYDAPGLREKMISTTEEKAAKAGGGGLLRTRLGSWLQSAQDEEQAIQGIHDQTIATRSKLYEAYFWRNLILPDNPNKEQAAKTVFNKVRFIGTLTEKQFSAPLNWQLEHADAYADLTARRDAGETMLSYLDEKNLRHWLDLQKLTPGVGTNAEIQSIVSEYVLHIQPMEEMFAYRENALEEPKNAPVKIRFALGTKLLHSIHDAERRIKEVDWKGFEISGGEQISRNIVRAYLAGKIDTLFSKAIPELVNGNVLPEEYEKLLTDCKAILQELKTSDTDAYLQKATVSFVDGVPETVKTAEINPLMKILIGQENQESPPPDHKPEKE